VKTTNSTADRCPLAATELEGQIKISLPSSYAPLLTPAEARAFAAQLNALARRIENRNPDTIET